MNLNIRKAQSNDMANVLRLIKELAEFENEPNAVEVTVDDLIAYGTGNNPDFTCFVAEDESGIIGIALVYFRFSTWKGRTVHLEDLIVKQEKRGMGVGLALYTAVIDYAAKLNVRRVEWVVLGWNEPAIKFYKNSGARILDDWLTVQMDEGGMNSFLESRKGLL
ncbi:MAG: GNAT family N-acetyltransferase [Leeuwenhoekiella sp.]